MSPDSLQDARVLITGGLGFIGSTLAIRLVELGAQVTIIDSMIPEYGGNLWNIESVRSKVRVNISDVRDDHAVKYLIQDQDVLFNLAGQTSHLDSMEQPHADLEINARAQLSILEACRRYNPGIKIVFASTRQIYGKPAYLPVDEGHPLHPVDVNGINKLAGEMYHLLYHQVYGIQTTVLRLTNTYGPRMRVVDARQTFLGIWVRRLLESQPILIYGTGNQLRDFTYVNDVVDALVLVARSKEANGEIFNLGHDRPVSLRETAEQLIALHGNGTYQLTPFPAERQMIDIGDYYGDFGKIHRSLGWIPTTSLREGLQRTLEFYERNAAHYWPAAIAV